MSSLLLSVLILAIAVVATVAAANLVQSTSRRRRLAMSRSQLEAGLRSGSAADGAAPHDEAAGLQPRGPGGVGPRVGARAERREPHLGDLGVADERADPQFSSASVTDIGGPEPDGTLGGARRADVGVDADTGAAGAAASAAADAPDAGAEAGRGEGRIEGCVAPPAPVLSAVCDCIVTLSLDAPVAGERLLALTRGIRRAGGKPILVDGVPVGAGEADAVPLTAGAHYWALRIGVLLANRSGPLNAMEYSDFVLSVQSVADQLSALADTPDMADVISRARDLDSTCEQLDAQIGLNVETPEPLGPAQLAGLASTLGMSDRGGHRHSWLGTDGEIVFTLSLADAPRRLSFVLDVPRTPESLDPWSLMLDCAQKVAAHLGGRLVDDDGRPIQLDALGTITRQLGLRYRSLEEIGLPAGSPPALRVFN